METNTKIYSQQYYQKNKEKVLNYAKKYYQKNKNKMLEYSKKWRLNNPEKAKESVRKYQLKIRDKFLQYKKQYHANHLDEYRQYSRKAYNKLKQRKLEEEMNRKWHTNKTQPNASNEFEILIIWKNGNISIDMPNLDEWNKLYLVENDTYWKDIKEYIVYWQYTDKLFKKELELTRRNYGHK